MRSEPRGGYQRQMGTKSKNPTQELRIKNPIKKGAILRELKSREEAFLVGKSSTCAPQEQIRWGVRGM